MANQISGRIYYISPVQEIQGRTGNIFKKCELWVTPCYFDRNSGEPTDGQVEETIKIDVTQERIAMLNTFAAGNDVTVSFDLRGRLYTDRENNTKCITSVEMRSIRASVRSSVPEPIAQQPAQQPMQAVAPSAPQYPQAAPQYGGYAQPTQQPLPGQTNLPF